MAGRRNRQVGRGTVLVAGALLLAVPGVGQTLHVTPDARPGGRCSVDSPCTLAEAQGQARHMAPAQHDDIHIVMAGGLYPIERPVALTARDSGRNGHRVVWEAAAGARPVWRGGVAIAGWTLFDAQRGIWRAAMPPSITGATFFIDGQRAERARTADTDAVTVTPTGFRFNDPAILKRLKWRPDLELVRHWLWQSSRCAVSAIVDGEIRVSPICFHNSRSVKTLRLENSYDLLTEPGQYYADPHGAISGAAAIYYRPRPGQDMGRVEAWIGTDRALLTISGTAEQPVHDITFRGITFRGGGWDWRRSTAGRVGGYASLQANLYLLSPVDLTNLSPPTPPRQNFGFYDPVNAAYLDYLPGAIQVDFARRIGFEDSRVEQTGGAGLTMVHGIRDSWVTGSVLREIGANAVQLGGVERGDHHPCGDVETCDTAAVTSDNRIENNLIDGVGKEFRDAIGLTVFFARNTIVAHNEIRDIPYTAISVGFGWGYLDPVGQGGWVGFRHPTIAGGNRILANDIHHHMTMMDDGGAIYTDGAQPGSVIAENFIHDVRPIAFTGGIYLDEGTVGYDVHDNVLTETMYYVTTNCGAHDTNFGNRIEHNYSHHGALFHGCLPTKTQATYRVDDNHYGSAVVIYRKNPPADAKRIMDAAGRSPEFRRAAP